MYIFYAILGIIFLFLDLKKRSILKLSLACAFLFCSIIAYKFSQNIYYQMICLLSFASLFHLMIKTTLKKEQQHIKKEKSLDNFIGKKAVVVKDIGKTLSIDGIGYIRYNKDLWQAKSIDDKEIKSGMKVEILSKENKIMNVRAIK